MSSNYQNLNLSDTIFRCMQKLTVMDSQLTQLQNLFSSIDYKDLLSRVDALEEAVSDIEDQLYGLAYSP